MEFTLSSNAVIFHLGYIRIVQNSVKKFHCDSKIYIEKEIINANNSCEEKINIETITKNRPGKNS